MKQATELEFQDLIKKYSSRNSLSNTPEKVFADVMSEGYSLLTASSVISKIFGLTLSQSRNVSHGYWKKNIKPKEN